MKKVRYRNSFKQDRFRCMNLWINYGGETSYVWSYDTLIGYMNWRDKKFYTWGYSRYSTTTSKQITILCNYYKAKRVDIEIPDILKD